MADGDTVWLTGRDRSGSTADRVYHTDRDCPALDRIDNPQPKDRPIVDDLEDTGRARECRRCAGTNEPRGPSEPYRMRDRLLEMDPEDAGLSPMPSSETGYGP